MADFVFLTSGMNSKRNFSLGNILNNLSYFWKLFSPFLAVKPRSTETTSYAFLQIVSFYVLIYLCIVSPELSSEETEQSLSCPLLLCAVCSIMSLYTTLFWRLHGIFWCCRWILPPHDFKFGWCNLVNLDQFQIWMKNTQVLIKKLISCIRIDFNGWFLFFFNCLSCCSWFNCERVFVFWAKNVFWVIFL